MHRFGPSLNSHISVAPLCWTGNWGSDILGLRQIPRISGNCISWEECVFKNSRLVSSHTPRRTRKRMSFDFNPVCLNSGSLEHMYWCALLSQVPSQAMIRALRVVSSITITIEFKVKLNRIFIGCCYSTNIIMHQKNRFFTMIWLMFRLKPTHLKHWLRHSELRPSTFFKLTFGQEG